MIKVYVASPVANAVRARWLGEQLAASGMRVVSDWAAEATSKGPAIRDPSCADARRSVLYANIRALDLADIVVVLADEGAPRATYGEIAWALSRGVPVVWVQGRHGEGANIWDAHPLVRIVVASYHDHDTARVVEHTVRSIVVDRCTAESEHVALARACGRRVWT